MTEKNTHGPAFPVSAGHEVLSSGMTLRDFIAVHIISGVLQCGYHKQDDHKKMSQEAYEIADAMLEVRES